MPGPMWSPLVQLFCGRYQYIPHRPEEVGEWWLPRRKGFQLKQWRAKCKCKCGSDLHAPTGSHRCTGCGCGAFVSDFLCVVCDRKWEEHETVTESAAERFCPSFWRYWMPPVL